MIHVLLPLILRGEGRKGKIPNGKNRAINEERKRKDEGREGKREEMKKGIFAKGVVHIALKLGQCLRITGFSFRLEISKKESGLPQKETVV